MIARYTLPEMGAIWAEEADLQAWLEVELAAVRAWNRLGKVPDAAVADIEATAAFDAARIAESKRRPTTTSSLFSPTWPSTSATPPSTSTTA